MKKILLLSTMVLALLACGQDNEKTKGETKAVSSTAIEKKVENPAKKRGGTINLAITAKFEGKFNPSLSSTAYDSKVNSYIFETMLSYGNDFKFKPGSLVENYEYKPEKMQYIFHIKKGVKFQDGVELTSEDVKFTYSLYARPEYDGRSSFASASIKGFQEVADGKVRYISGIETPDKYTVIFNMTEANARSLNNFVSRIMPKHYYEYDKPENYKTEFLTKNETPLGSGPYKLTEYKPGEYVVLDRFTDFHQGPSEVQKIVIRYIPSDSVSPALGTGDLDIASLPGRKSKEKELASSNNLVNFQNTPPAKYSYIGFNLRKDKFKDKSVRQALAYGLNRELYADKVLEGYAKVVNQPLVPQHWASSKNVNDYAYNPEKAKKMLEDDGWKTGNDGFRYKDGEKLAFVLETAASSGQSSTGKTLIALIKQNWKEIGVDVDIQLVDFNAMVKDIDSKEPKFDTIMLAWSTIADPDQSNTFKTGGSNNFVGYSNSIVDELSVEGLAKNNPEERAPIYDKLIKQINEDLPYIFLVSPTGVEGINKRISGLDYMNDMTIGEAVMDNTVKLER
ncbi:ABC transporter substrate-binding protein [Psychrilyobacter atlanticus]|uniref:ABC transporter substrate-binding protein n=1 Tax=Psychrilyobacter atlanticus TaxID=271091 RepID=UPI0004127FAB|nr:ABC transporter substrate-binding protein [Psychrilyobacter atlanticus]